MNMEMIFITEFLRRMHAARLAGVPNPDERAIFVDVCFDLDAARRAWLQAETKLLDLE